MDAIRDCQAWHDLFMFHLMLCMRQSHADYIQVQNLPQNVPKISKFAIFITVFGISKQNAF